MYPAFSFITNATRFGIESSSVEQILAILSSWYQVLIIATISFSIVEQSTLLILLLIITNKFSVGLRSGEFPDRRVVSPFSSKNARFSSRYGKEQGPAGKSHPHQENYFAEQEANEFAILPCICRYSSFPQH